MRLIPWKVLKLLCALFLLWLLFFVSYLALMNKAVSSEVKLYLSFCSLTALAYLFAPTSNEK